MVGLISILRPTTHNKINIYLASWQNQSQDNILYNRKKYILPLQIEMRKNIELFERRRFSWIKVFRKTSVKPLKSIVNKINYSAFDSGHDALSHALFKKIDKFDKNQLFLGGGWVLINLKKHIHKYITLYFIF